MYIVMTEIFWLKDPMSLLNKDYITNVVPSKDLSYDAKLNAITRLIIIICVLGYLLTRNIRIIISAIISIIGIIIMYNINKGKQNQKKIIGKALKEGFNSDILYNLSKSSMTTPTKENPLMNVMLPEIQDNPKRNMAAPSFAPKVEKASGPKTMTPQPKAQPKTTTVFKPKQVEKVEVVQKEAKSVDTFKPKTETSTAKKGIDAALDGLE